MKQAGRCGAARPGVQRILGAVLLLALAACGGGGGDDDGPSRAAAQGGGVGGSGVGHTGLLALALTDAPACGFDAAYVTVTELRFSQNGSDGGSGAGWIDMPLPLPLRVNLLTLTNGRTASLGVFGVAGGMYTQMRVMLAPNDAAHPLANSVVPTGGVEVPLATPGAQQSGIKINAAMAVPAGGIGSYVMQVDACQSIVTGGQPGQYVLNPVIQVTAAAASSPNGRQ